MIRQKEDTRISSDGAVRGWATIRIFFYGMILFVSVSFLASCTKAEPRAERNLVDPDWFNVLLISIDTLRADSLSLYGYERATSPNLDALANDSVVFTKAFSTATYTQPAMCAIMSGRFPYYHIDPEVKHGFFSGMNRFSPNNQDLGLPQSLDTLAELLQREGYSTSGFITNGQLMKKFHMDQGFDKYRAMFAGPPSKTPYRPAEHVVAEVIDWLDETATAPFFLFTHFNDVHYPYLAPEDYLSPFSFDRVPNLSDEALQKPWLGEQGLSASMAPIMREHAKGLYDTEIHYLDYWIGQMLDKLREKGVLENTIIVITSDHGEEFLEHDGTTHKGKLFDELLHVPLIIHVPGTEARVVDGLVQNFDVMPTILDYCNIRLPDGIDATSLRPMVSGETNSLNSYVYSNLPTRDRIVFSPQHQMIRTENRKLIYDVANPENSYLFNLIEDPSEQHNIYSESLLELDDLLQKLAEVTQKMIAEEKENGLDAITSEVDPVDALDEETREHLRALGYLE